MHHRLVKCNYGLYFNFWDRVMKTNHPHYEESILTKLLKNGNRAKNAIPVISPEAVLEV